MTDADVAVLKAQHATIARELKDLRERVRRLEMRVTFLAAIAAAAGGLAGNLLGG